MLEKLNSIVYDRKRQKVIKQIVGRFETASERITLKLLGDRPVDPARESPFLVPNVYEDECSLYRVCMTHIRGIRVYELIATLNEIVETFPDRKMVRKAFTLKNQLINWAIDDLRCFQSDTVQQSLKENLGPLVTAYDFHGKFMEALSYISACFGIELKTGLLNEVDFICEFLSQQAEVTFRDANLKNRILELPESGKLKFGYEGFTVEAGHYQRPSDWQWTNPELIIRLLEISTEIDDLKGQIYNLDFESAYTLTTRQDDYLHILASEAVGWEYEVAEPFWSKELGITEDAYNYALLFRCFREWVRRLFYRCERPGIFMTRYHHETLSYNFYLAFDALKRLRRSSDEKDFLGNLYSLMCTCEPR